MTRPLLNIHVDVDNLWIAEQEQGLPESELQGLVFRDAMPRFLNAFAHAGVKATFFVVGRDIEMLPDCQTFCREAVKAGHRLGNHTYSHPPDPARLSRDEKRREVLLTDRLLTEHGGLKTTGFRGPGYYIDDEFLTVLEENGYIYDTSVLPGPGVFLMQLYFLATTRSASGKIFGRPVYPFISRRPHRLRPRSQGNHAGLVELPITTMPFLRTPMHTTFVYQFGMRYVKAAMGLLRRQAGPHAYIFHAIDLLDYPQDGPLMGRIVPLRWPLTRRLDLVKWLLDQTEQFDVVTTEEMLASSAVDLGLVSNTVLDRHLAPSR